MVRKLNLRPSFFPRKIQPLRGRGARRRMKGGETERPPKHDLTDVGAIDVGAFSHKKSDAFTLPTPCSMQARKRKKHCQTQDDSQFSSE